jgi:outer membrane autotransporter protein
MKNSYWISVVGAIPTAAATVTFTVLALVASAPEVKADPFTGPYAGVSVGYETYSGPLSGATYGAFVGWDIRLGDAWVVGPELRFGDTTAKQTEVRNTATFTATATTRINTQLGAQLRVGRLLNERTLVYVAGGWERFDVDAEVVTQPKAPCTTCTASTQDFSFSENVWTVSAGTEWAFHDRWRVRAAYTYANGDAYTRHGFSAALAYQF